MATNKDSAQRSKASSFFVGDCRSKAASYLVGFVPVTTHAKISSFTAKKIEAVKLMNSQIEQRAKEYRATYPNENPVILPLGPDPKLKVERVSPKIEWGIGWLSSGPYRVSELWIVGDKMNYQQKAWNTAYAFSGCLKINPRQGVIGTFVLNGASDKSWSGVWKTPELWGSVKITNVSGNIVSFTTESGVKGTFNLSTHAWRKKQ